MVHVTPARAADLDAITSTLAEAFEADPPAASMVPFGTPRRPARLAALFSAVLASGPLAQGTVDVARDADSGAVLGAAIWHRPGADRTAVGHYLPQAWRFVRALGPWGVGRAVRVARASAAHRPAGEHWYLQAVGVHPEARGRGVGTALLGHRLASVDAVGAAAYLESSTMASTVLYRRWGFLALGRVTGFPVPGAPTAMWRPPVVPAGRGLPVGA